LLTGWVGHRVAWAWASSYYAAVVSAQPVSVATLPLVCLLIFGVGYWIGIRGRTSAVATARVVAVAVKFIDLAIGFITLLSMPYTSYELYGVSKDDLPEVWPGVVAGIVIFSALCAAGSWWECVVGRLAISTTC
jgi:hypothetical protein